MHPLLRTPRPLRSNALPFPTAESKKGSRAQGAGARSLHAWSRSLQGAGARACRCGRQVGEERDAQPPLGQRVQGGRACACACGELAHAHVGKRTPAWSAEVARLWPSCTGPASTSRALSVSRAHEARLASPATTPPGIVASDSHGAKAMCAGGVVQTPPEQLQNSCNFPANMQYRPRAGLAAC
jgi:hypothetical protein